MTNLEEAEKAWKQQPKPRKRSLQKSIDNLQAVPGALADLMLDYLRYTFIVNYIRGKDEQDTRSHETATTQTPV